MAVAGQVVPAIPHFVVLSLLWVAFVVLTLIAFVAILFTGRYPRLIFEFNVGVLRWTWRVSYYATSALGTDRYPPFTLGAADYPATLDVVYPEHLSRGLVLIKSWLLALPQLVFVAVLTASWGFGQHDGAGFLMSGGLLGLLVFVGALTLLFTGHYPPRLHDLVVGASGRQQPRPTRRRQVVEPWPPSPLRASVRRTARMSVSLSSSGGALMCPLSAVVGVSDLSAECPGSLLGHRSTMRESTALQ